MTEYHGNSNERDHDASTANAISDGTRPKIWIRIPQFLCKHGAFLVKKLLTKIQRNLAQSVKFVVGCDTNKKLSYFLHKKRQNF